jgi:sterol desaturase/sphingolipid hydroxylase (fatty acid hydroxylase superfamily)
MEDFELIIRVGCFCLVLIAMSLWEAIAPRRALAVSKSLRWTSNLGLSALNTMATRAVSVLGAMGIAAIAEEQDWGLLNNVHVPYWLALAVSFILLDLAIYLQHVLFHAVPALWRLHRVHHADLDFDVSTGLRFHTIEILLSLAIKGAAIAVLGPPPLAVLLFEVMLNATSMFNHGNVRIPARLERLLRLVVVTPEMHRVHHSIHVDETNSNYGFNLPWWDYLLGTYRAQPRDGHEQMTIGVPQFRDVWVDRLDWMLLLPFLKRTQKTAQRGESTVQQPTVQQPTAIQQAISQQASIASAPQRLAE